MLRALSLPEVELSIVLCDDASMRSLNRRFRKIDRTTDVLAFAMGEGFRMPAVAGAPLGDVVISLPTATRQARAAGKRPIDEITMLLAHGLLHLLGFDHRSAAEERRMRARTDALIGAAQGDEPEPRGCG
jgi:probable rRNA maturation factor